MNAPDLQPVLYSPEQAVEVLGLRNLKQFYRLVAAGHIPTVRIGKLLRVPRRSLDATIAAQLPRACRQSTPRPNGGPLHTV